MTYTISIENFHEKTCKKSPVLQEETKTIFVIYRMFHDLHDFHRKFSWKNVQKITSVTKRDKDFVTPWFVRKASLGLGDIVLDKVPKKVKSWKSEKAEVIRTLKNNIADDEFLNMSRNIKKTSRNLLKKLKVVIHEKMNKTASKL